MNEIDLWQEAENFEYADEDTITRAFIGREDFD